MTFSVIVVTFQRPASLEKCLLGLERQIRKPEEVVVVIQERDRGTQTLLDGRAPWAAIKVVRVNHIGAVRQYNAGLDVAKGDIVTFIDDDAIARPDWLMRIEQHFTADPGLGGVGGRDHVTENGQILGGPAQMVGVVRWFGRVIGNHHLETRGIKKVDILKGVNMSFRRVAIGNARFDTMLRGTGAQTCCDMGFSFDVGGQGWRLIYDPEAAVDHYPAPRFDADKRGVPEDSAIANNSFNLYSTLRRHMQPGTRRQAALTWALWIGTAKMPGILRGLVYRLTNDDRGRHLRDLARRSWQEASSLSTIKSH